MGGMLQGKAAQTNTHECRVWTLPDRITCLEGQSTRQAMRHPPARDANVKLTFLKRSTGCWAVRMGGSVTEKVITPSPGGGWL